MKSFSHFQEKLPFFAFQLIILLGGPLTNAQISSNNECISCHQEIVIKNYVHGPTAIDCKSCHKLLEGQLHNNENTGGMTLVSQGKELCFGCHTDISAQFDLRYKHEPVEDGSCTGCHDPHSSDFAKMVSNSAPSLCFSCHDTMETGRAEAKTVHTPSFEEGACSSCHTPHASKEKRLLAKRSKDLCLDCHNRRIQKADETILKNIDKHIAENEFIHKALNRRCTSCHNAHYSSRKLMLKDEFIVGNYVKGVEENFALCFGCHDSDLLALENTTFTLFRQGERNLHYVHVNKDKGRNCTLCHDIHAAKNPQLVATTVKFGRWEMPLNYISTETGGSCLTGCHKEQSYNREVSN